MSIVCFTVYDITKRATFLNLQRWVEEVRRYTSSNVLLVLIGKCLHYILSCALLCYTINVICAGNKCDLEENRQVELSEADAMCEYFPELLSVLETSAKENKNIEEAFVTIASELKVIIGFSIVYFKVNTIEQIFIETP